MEWAFVWDDLTYQKLLMNAADGLVAHWLRLGVSRNAGTQGASKRGGSKDHLVETSLQKKEGSKPSLTQLIMDLCVLPLLLTLLHAE